MIPFCYYSRGQQTAIIVLQYAEEEQEGRSVVVGGSDTFEFAYVLMALLRGDIGKYIVGSFIFQSNPKGGLVISHRGDPEYDHYLSPKRVMFIIKDLLIAYITHEGLL